jgi:uncharacterized oligopeptide transporter (OPT) family protein
LKTGWALGVAITACILSFAIYRTLVALFPKLFRTEMGILENNCMQSTASSAGYSTGGALTSAIAAYVMITGHHIPWPIRLRLAGAPLLVRSGTWANSSRGKGTNRMRSLGSKFRIPGF